MTPWKKFLFGLSAAGRAALICLLLNSCVPGGGGGGIGNLFSGGGIENPATEPPPTGDSKTNSDETRSENDETELIAVSYFGDPNLQAPPSARPGSSFPDPLPNIADCQRYAYINLMKEKDACVVSNGPDGKRVRVELMAELFVNCDWPSDQMRLRVVDRKDHEFLDTAKIHTCSNPALGVFPCVKFTLITSPHTFGIPSSGDLKLRLFFIPPNFEPKQANVELPCGDAGRCRLKEDYRLPIGFNPMNLSEVVSQARDCPSLAEGDPSQN